MEVDLQGNTGSALCGGHSAPQCSDAAVLQQVTAAIPSSCEPEAQLLARLSEMDLSHEDLLAIDEYGSWAVIYSLNQNEGDAALSIIGTGLPGECGELLEQVAFVGTCMGDELSLQLEFGDVLFYLLRMARHFGIDLRQVILVPKDLSVLPAGHARMPISVGMVSEAVKKHIRNDKLVVKDRRLNKLRNALGLLWQDWWALRERHEVDLHELMQLSRAKFVKRERAQQRRLLKGTQADDSRIP